VSKAPQLEQTGSQSPATLWQLSQTHCGPRGADRARVRSRRTVASGAPSPRLDGGEKREHPRVRHRLGQVAQRAAGGREILGGDVQLGQE
jgi:hypothetical protein